ncbi:MAG: hypothetical protein HWN68_12090 [Desulfobacterales bacterium]|nr:hypothetical protein [Desulfobacterales bacterium]
MEASISQVVHDAGQKLAVSTGSLADALNQTLNQLLVWPFRATKGFARDTEGQKTDIFGTLIYTVSQSQPTPERLNFNTDNVACVIDVDESLGVEQLRAAYERIACAKRLKKTLAPDVPGVPYTTVTLGIIFARDASVPFETLAEEIDRLNRQHPDREWTDMVVVLSKGIINYAVQFPGENVVGDFLPPAEGALARYSPPIYVIIVVRPTGRFAFNKMYSFLTAHLMIFSPGANLPNFNRILEGTPKKGMTLTGYQYNLSGNLMPVPRQFYNDRYIPPRPFLIEDQQGNVLSTIKFLPWQDGGVVLLKGKLPLDGLLIFLGKKALKRGGIVRRADGQISYVLPITQADFTQMLQSIQRQTNMVVKLDPSKFVFQKMMDEGSRSPFIARLLLGILRLRDVIFPDYAKRDIFDKPYEPVVEALLNTRSASQEIAQLVADHFSKLAKGEVGQLRGHTIHIEKPIDKELRKEVEIFLNSAVRALKQGMQEVTKVLGFNIGFLFKKQNAFENGVRGLEKYDPHLAAYLRETRKWSERLINSRNDLEHYGWILPKVRYTEVSGVIRANEPEISGQKVCDFVKFIMDRLICFVEEVTVHCLKAQMPVGISMTEIPLSQRESDIPERFRATLTNGGMPIWNIAYHDSLFEET